jgi:hypothetical protein
MITLISHNHEKQKDIEALGATIAIGSIEDVNFLATSYAGADTVYTMLRPPNLANSDLGPATQPRFPGLFSFASILIIPLSLHL